MPPSHAYASWAPIEKYIVFVSVFVTEYLICILSFFNVYIRECEKKSVKNNPSMIEYK